MCLCILVINFCKHNSHNSFSLLKLDSSWTDWFVDTGDVFAEIFMSFGPLRAFVSSKTLYGRTSQAPAVFPCNSFETLHASLHKLRFLEKHVVSCYQLITFFSRNRAFSRIIRVLEITSRSTNVSLIIYYIISQKQTFDIIPKFRYLLRWLPVLF